MTPLKLDRFDQLQQYVKKVQMPSGIVICGCGARNLTGATRCWKCHKPFKSTKCPILPNWSTRKDGKCKRFSHCDFSADTRCPATGDT